jgi:hydroxymethylglutaryl-CoA synthase
MELLMKKNVGIDAIAAYFPRLYLDLCAEWSERRAVAMGEPSVEKFRQKLRNGIGAFEMSVPDYHEDAATMAAMAAIRLIDEQRIDPRDIGLIAVGTESAVDQSKSIAAYVLGMLERYYDVSLPNVGTPQYQFACIGATYALESALARLRAGDDATRYALVIATDVSRYPLLSTGECTQGAGAVALLLSESPRLLEIDSGRTGTVTRDERDFFRPNWSRTAMVDGKYSVDLYLDCIEAAWRHRAERIASAGDALGGAERYDHFDFILFHTPFPKMAEYAAARILGLLWAGDPHWGPLVQGLEQGGRDRRESERLLRASPRFRAEFERKVAPSLVLARRIGNVYSASLPLALVSLLEATRDQGDLTGKRALFFSYGSGASAKVFSGRFGARYRQAISPTSLLAELEPVVSGGRRVPLTMAQYEAVHSYREYQPDTPEAVMEKLRTGALLEDGDRQAILRALAGEAIRLTDPPPSVGPCEGEFALSNIGKETGPKVHDRGYRYYTWAARSQPAPSGPLPPAPGC